MKNSFHPISPIENTLAKNTSVFFLRSIVLGQLTISLFIMFILFYATLLYPFLSIGVYISIILFRFLQTTININILQHTPIRKAGGNILYSLRNNDETTIGIVYNGEIGKQIRKMVIKSGGSYAEAEDVLFFSIQRAISIINDDTDLRLDDKGGFFISIAESIIEEGKNTIKSTDRLLSDKNIEEIDSFKERVFLSKHMIRMTTDCREYFVERYVKGREVNQIVTSKNLSKKTIKECINRLRVLMS